MSSVTALHRKFLQENVPSIKRIGSGHIALLEILLTKIRSRPKINEDDQLFIAAKEMQALTRDYALIRCACCKMKGYHNKDTGTCDLIVGWTPAFSELSIRLQTEAVKTALSIRRSGESIQYVVLPFPAADSLAFVSSLLTVPCPPPLVRLYPPGDIVPNSAIQ